MTTKSAPIIGIDLGDRKHAVCVLSQDGELLEESKIGTTRESLALFSQKYPMGMNEQIKEQERAIAELAAVKYPETSLLTQITGVGVLTALTFVLTIEDPSRFSRVRDIGAYPRASAETRPIRRSRQTASY